MEWYLKVVRDNYANFSGRARRKEYWMFVLFNTLFLVAAMVLDFILGTIVLFYMIYLLALFLPMLSAGVRRLHDTGRSGWWMLLNIIPLIGPIIFLILLCTDSTPGSNEYGPNPKSQRAEFEESTVVELDPESYDDSEIEVDEIDNIPNPIILTVVSGPNKGSFFPVSGDATIGRAHDNDIVLGLKTVSGYHCKISIEGGQFVLNDLGSTNGTIVDGEKVTRAVIKDGTVVELSKVRLKVSS